jgi:hypothetical protein
MSKCLEKRKTKRYLCSRFRRKTNGSRAKRSADILEADDAGRDYFSPSGQKSSDVRKIVLVE